MTRRKEALVINTYSQSTEPYSALARHYANYSQRYLPYLNSVDELVMTDCVGYTSLLDIGCGDGRRLDKLRRRCSFSLVDATEPCEELAILCEQRIGKKIFRFRAEEVNSLGKEKYQVVTLMWNVLGHVPTAGRKEVVAKIYDLLAPNGIVILDVNNRYNMPSYGVITVLYRILLDWIDFKEQRGDTQFTWDIDGQRIPARGHVFTPKEVINLFPPNNFLLSKMLSVNYKTGKVHDDVRQGQLYFVFKKS
jgi:2-polyprenyl-3-methyl-5-hydroxy-6-metoxy-1,4-benzoquinol methylase